MIEVSQPIYCIKCMLVGRWYILYFLEISSHFKIRGPRTWLHVLSTHSNAKYHHTVLWQSRRLQLYVCTCTLYMHTSRLIEAVQAHVSLSVNTTFGIQLPWNCHRIRWGLEVNSFCDKTSRKYRSIYSLYQKLTSYFIYHQFNAMQCHRRIRNDLVFAVPDEPSEGSGDYSSPCTFPKWQQNDKTISTF